MTFADNNATDGGAMHCINSIILLHDNSTVKFYNNRAVQQGGAVNNIHRTYVTFHGNSLILYHL